MTRGGSLRARGIRINHGRRTIIEYLDLDVRSGKPLLVTGRNGAGKTSLLRVLARLHPPARGWVRHSPPGKITWVTPGATLPPRIRSRHWIQLVRSTGRPLLPSAESLLPCHLSPGTRLGRLSTGEERRLLLWAALRNPGSVVILDEPFDHLSPDGIPVLERIITRLAGTRPLILATNRRLSPKLQRSGWGHLQLEPGR